MLLSQMEYSPLRLAIEMDTIAMWIKDTHPDFTPEKVAEYLREEVDRIEEEMQNGDL